MMELEKVLRSALNNWRPLHYSVKEPLTPKPAKEIFWFCSEIVNLVTQRKSLDNVLDILKHGQEAVWMADDPLPFLALHFLQTPVLFIKAIINVKKWNLVDFRLEEGFLSYVSQVFLHIATG